jgi:preprotein translocase subunit YajC
MSSFVVGEMMAMAPPSQPGTQQDPTGQLVYMLGMFAIMGVMFYFMLIRPQKKKQADHENLLKSLRPGDRIVTSGGIVGVVVSVKDKTVSVRSAETKLELLKSAVSDITERSGDTAEK